MKIKRLLAGIISATMTFGSLTFGTAVSAEGGLVTSGDYEYQLLWGNEAMLYYYRGDDVNWELPSEIDGYKVTYVGSGISTYLEHEVESISVPEGITHIQADAFSNLEKLKQIELPSSLEHIGDNVFKGCESLTSITLPENIHTLYGGLFDGCESLTDINILGDITLIQGKPFENSAWLEQQRAKNDLVIVSDIIVDGTSWQGAMLYMPKGVEQVCEGAFAGHMNLVYVIANQELKTISAEAFKDCPNLASLSLNSGIEKIEDLAFANTSLTTILGEKNITNLKSVTTESFSNTPWYTNKLESGQLITLGSTFLGCGSTTGIINIPYGIKFIAPKAFDGITIDVTEIVLPRTVQHIGYYAFGHIPNNTIIKIKSKDFTYDTPGTLSYRNDIYGYGGDLLEATAAEHFAVSLNGHFVPLEEELLCDLNYDGELGIADIIIMKKYLLGIEKTCPDLEQADLTGDVVVNIFDYIALQRIVMNM